jgi:parallel beta-helix repeat protein
MNQKYIFYFLIICCLVACKKEEIETKPIKQADGSYLVLGSGNIQDAIYLLKDSGGVINVEPGTYYENIYLSSNIKLISTKKHGAIIKPLLTSKYCITGWGVTNVSISNFSIEGGIQIGQESSDFSYIAQSIIIQDNKITNLGAKDGIHIGGADSVKILNNDISYSNSEQGIDLVGVKNFTISGNKVHDIKNSTGMGIVAKGGSINGVITNNEVYNCGNAAIACGQTSTETWIWPEAITAKYEAKNIAVTHNNIHDNSKFAFLVQAATSSRIDSNTIGNSNYYALIAIYNSSETHNPSWHSSDITITQPSLNVSKLDLKTDGVNIIFNGVKIK